MHQYDISIIIVNYNVRDYLYKCLRSIIDAKRNLSVEIIVVDNNSQDNSVDYLKPKFPEVKFISLSENIGFGKANNAGIAEAGGKYLLILNPDTILQENTLEVMHDYMENHSEVGISICKVLNADGTFQSSCRRGFPTPFASFSKLFGLQALFPKSKIFGKYNQTFMPVDETYYTEAVSGCFMFSKAEIIRSVGGFDSDFFMYGEDLDLCYRVHNSGYKNAYVHTTSIIHYKGESSKRSSQNDIRHFYDAMEIFIRKHYSGSGLFLQFMKAGIKIRSLFAYLSKYKRDLMLITFDVAALIISLFIGTYIVFGDFTGFPDYAYPIVFIIPSFVLIISMILAGEYFESSGSITNTVFGYTLSFLILSTLTYFFTEYRFSRGTLLSTIAVSILISSGFRIFLNSFLRTGLPQQVRAAFLGGPSSFSQMLDDFRAGNPLDINLIGYISEESSDSEADVNWLGKLRHLDSIIRENKINNIIITDPEMSSEKVMQILSGNSVRNTKFHLAHRYEDFVASQLINNITFTSSMLPRYNINILRYRIIKRVFDFSLAFMLIAGILPLIMLRKKFSFRSLAKILSGKNTFVGVKQDKARYEGIKPGLLSLADLSSIKPLPDKSINEINEYYLKNYSVSLDFEIIIKYLSTK